MKIGELARISGTTVEAIRYYEQEGLLGAPARTASNYRFYGADAAERLHFIRRCRSLDMALPEVRALLAARDRPDSSCEAVNALIDAHIGHVAERIRELNGLDQELKALRASCLAPDSAEHCGILDGLARDPIATPVDACAGSHASAPVQGQHVGGSHAGGHGGGSPQR